MNISLSTNEACVASASFVRPSRRSPQVEDKSGFAQLGPMFNSQNEHIICGGVSFENMPVALREKVAFRNGQIPEALEQMK
jgi:hypothetical protein